MEQGFIERVSKEGSRTRRYVAVVMFIVFAVVAGGLALLLKDSLDPNEPTDQKLMTAFAFLSAFMLIMTAAALISSFTIHLKGRCLILPFKENTKEETAKLINREAAEGGILVDEYIDEFPEGKRPFGERVILTSSYLLLCNGMGRIQAIPRGRIYWLCAQVGRRGESSFIVRLLVFTHLKCFYLDGASVNHLNKVAEKLYQHIPDIFAGQDPFILSYFLEELFDKDRAGFLELYESEKSKRMDRPERKYNKE